MLDHDIVALDSAVTVVVLLKGYVDALHNLINIILLVLKVEVFKLIKL